MKKNIDNKKGFTLAEVLITLTVFGVLAAILIPAVEKLVPDDRKVMIKKASYVLQQAISIMSNDNVNYPADKTVVVDTITYQRGFNFTDATTNTVGGTTYNKFCYILAENLNSTGSNTLCPASGAAADTSATLFATTTDGMKWYISRTSATDASDFAVATPTNSYRTRIVIDVNGGKDPNCSTDTAAATYIPTAYVACPADTTPDTFIIGIRYDGKLRYVNSSEDEANMTVTDPVVQSILQSPTDNTK